MKLDLNSICVEEDLQKDGREKLQFASDRVTNTLAQHLIILCLDVSVTAFAQVFRNLTFHNVRGRVSDIFPIGVGLAPPK